MAKVKTSGIYKILNIANNKFYIGRSKDIDGRWRQHKSKLNLNKHPNEHLQNAWDKYGKSNFAITIVETVKETNLIEREQYWLDTLRPYDRGVGYNINPSAETFIKIRGTCKIKGCGLPHFGKGYCIRHYHKQ